MFRDANPAPDGTGDGQRLLGQGWVVKSPGARPASALDSDHVAPSIAGRDTNVTSGVYLTAMSASRCISGAHEPLDVNLMANEAAVRVTLGRGECPHCPGQVLVPRLKPRGDELEDYGYCECCGSWWKQWKQPLGQPREPGTMDRRITMAPGLRTLADGKQGRHKPPAF